jgi:hypothetical protein
MASFRESDSGIVDVTRPVGRYCDVVRSHDLALTGQQAPHEIRCRLPA